MNPKWIGIVAILVGCGGLGFRTAAVYRQQTKELGQLLTILDLMTSELSYRLTPLPDLCLMAKEAARGNMGMLFHNLHRELERQVAPDAGYCMNAAVAESGLSTISKQLLRNLGRSLGRFDLDGQLRGIESVRNEAIEALNKLSRDQDARLRSYQTLGLCAGAAIAILLL